MGEAIQSIKIVLLGDSGVGKSSIVASYVHGTSPETMKPTVGAAFFTKEIIVAGQQVELLIWDTAGQEVYRGLAPMYYRSAKIAIIVYDITSQKSFDSVFFWVKELRNNVDGNITIAICGNKTDLGEARAVNTVDAQCKVEKMDLLYSETSAMSNTGIDFLFQSAVSRYFATNNGGKQEPIQGIDVKGQPPSEDKCC